MAEEVEEEEARRGSTCTPADGIFDVKAERVETESNEARAMELKAQVFEAERDRERLSCRENALKADFSEVEER